MKEKNFSFHFERVILSSKSLPLRFAVVEANLENSRKMKLQHPFQCVSFSVQFFNQFISDENISVRSQILWTN